jgi:hypothetical protein
VRRYASGLRREDVTFGDRRLVVNGSAKRITWRATQVGASYAFLCSRSWLGQFLDMVRHTEARLW